MVRCLTLVAALCIVGCGSEPSSDASLADASLPDADARTTVDVSVFDSIVFDMSGDVSGDVSDDQDALLPPPVAANISTVMENLRQQEGLIALSAGVASSRGLLALGAAGSRRRGTNTFVALNDRWHLGSLTKAMTATVAAHVVANSTLTWSTPMETVFSDFSSDIHPLYKPVSLAGIVSHRAGITGDYQRDFSFTWSRLWEGRQPVTAERRWVANELLTNAPATTPGQYRYANAGYMVAGAVLESSTGQSWEALMQERLFEPLDMKSCGFGAPATPGMEDAPWGYRENGTEVPPGPMADNPEALGPSGSVHCSLQDYAKFLSFHLRGHHGGQTALLSQETIRRLHGSAGFTPIDDQDDYGYGWLLLTRDWSNGLVLHHAGSNTNMIAVVWMAPNIDRAYFAMTNQAGQSRFDSLDEVIGSLIQMFPASP